MPITNTVIPFDTILVADRFRQDLGDIDELADSIATIGLIQPLCVRQVADGVYQLVAGGRRHAALARLRSGAPIPSTGTLRCDRFDKVPVYIVDHHIEEDMARTLELEENLRRKDMTWQEKVLGIGEIHRIRLRSARSIGQHWTCRQTGDVFGQSHASIAYAVKLSQAILDGDDDVLKASSAEEAVKILFVRKKREIEKYRATLQREAVASRKVKNGLMTVPPVVVHNQAEINEADQLVGPLDHATEAYERALDLVRLGNSIHTIMPSMSALTYNGIYTDIPYGIEADNIAGLRNFDDIVDTHDRESNIADFEQFLSQSYRVLKPGSWCVFWCDISHFSLLQSIATKVGFRCVPWPLISKKNIAKNEAAAFNPTKDYEIVMACCRGLSPLVTRRSTCFIPWEWADGEYGRFTHPFKKPFSVHKWLLETFFEKGRPILDPYCGEGTGVLAGLRLGYHVSGIDIEEHHVDRARQHVADWIRHSRGGLPTSTLSETAQTAPML